MPAKLTDSKILIINLTLLCKPHLHLLFHSRFSTALRHKHYFYFTKEGTADATEPVNYRADTEIPSWEYAFGENDSNLEAHGHCQHYPSLEFSQITHLPCILRQRLPSHAAHWATASPNQENHGSARPGLFPARQRRVYRAQPPLCPSPEGLPTIAD